MEQTTTGTRSRRYTITVLLTEWLQDESGGWCVGVWGLPGCATQGETVEEAERMIRDCYEGFIASYEEDGEEIPWTADFRHWEESEIRCVRW